MLTAVSVFTGSGMLDRSVGRALARIGFDLRIVAYIEREAHAQEVILARQRDGLLDRAGVWSDVTTFPAGSVRADAVIGGFPCQPMSIAGKRAGVEDERYLFPDMLRVADGVGARLLFCENVPGIWQSPAEVEYTGVEAYRNRLPGESSNAYWKRQHRAEHGERVEIAAARVIQRSAPLADVARRLAESGFTARWQNLAAEDVGAPHGRERWWCCAWR